MNITEKFFVECVTQGIKGEKIQNIPEELDYKQLYSLSATHSMAVVVYEALKNVQDKLSSQFLSALNYIVNRYIALDVQTEYDINTLLDAFEKNGIRYMPLKGYHIKKLYPSTEMRYISDCDVLIDVEQLDKVRTLVKDLSLETQRYDEHHDIVRYPTTKTVFELHKTIFVGPLEQYFGVGNEGFKRATIKEGYKYFYQMDNEIFYISILAHSAYHFATGAGVGIRHLTDIYLYRKAYKLNEKYLNIELEKCGLKNFKDEFEKVSAYFFEDSEADEFTKTLAKHIIESCLLSNHDKQSASLVASLSKEDGDDKKAKKRSFWRTLFPPNESMKFAYPILKKYGWLLPIFYFVRWVHVLITRPKRIAKLKSLKKVKQDDLSYMKEMRNKLGINHL